MDLNLMKEKSQKRVWKRCRRCRHLQKVHRAAKYCTTCRDLGHAGLLETV